ncbi:hypothetical protein [Chitinivibrio alkaliphilus]|uniref:Right handed beta helix domain-containing protein n=1 Tax=Chitinivibrio alkaliphilus ACht1 TaxID=1313304 RepID=U7D9G8_9BACT|nr:hypothetical protein [Chitinivibrio alkaliphilus]ERP31055.1 hypothetical protein CALK_2084 [Chitinivibrio alkaliphilus ACht1]
MMNRDDVRHIWVAPQASPEADGSYDEPFGSIGRAVEAVHPGGKIILREGVYREKVTLRDLHGTMEQPIVIMADPAAKEVVSMATWYLYSVQHLIVSNISFTETSGPALSVVGESHTNIFKQLILNDCGTTAECSLFFGGSGGVDNIVEGCHIYSSQENETHVGILLSQNIDREDEQIEVSKKQVVRFTTFSNLGVACIAGSGDDIGDYSYFKVEECTFRNCHTGLRVKANGTTLSDSLFFDCSTGVDHCGGGSCTVETSRFEGCERAVKCTHGDMLAVQNCLVDSSLFLGDDQCCAPNIFHHNTFVSTAEELLLPVRDAHACTAVFVENIFYNVFIDTTDDLFCSNNKCSGSSVAAQKDTVSFENMAEKNYATPLQHGCTGQAAYRRKISLPETIDLSHLAEVHGFSSQDLAGSVEKRELYMENLYPALSADDEDGRDEDGLPDVADDLW